MVRSFPYPLFKETPMKEVVSHEDPTDSGLKTGRWGLRFTQPQTEAAYHAWSDIMAVPFVRIGIIGCLISWASGIVEWTMGPYPNAFRATVLVLIVVVPTHVAVLAVTFIPRLIRWMLPMMAITNAAAGLCAVTVWAWVFPGIDLWICIIMIIAFIGLTVYRLHPLQIVLATLSYIVAAGVFWVIEWSCGRVSTQNFIPGIGTLFVIFLFGLIVCLVLEHVTRKSFSQERIIERQKREINERFTKVEMELAQRKTDLAHAEKLTTIGTLVASVAHEIDNPNTSIKLNTDLLHKSWAKLEPIHDEYAREHGDFDIGNIPYSEFKHEVVEALNSTSRNTDRIKKLVDDLRMFSRKDEGNFDETVDLNAVVKDAISILGATLRKATSRLTVSFTSEHLCIKGNTLRLEQVVVNVLNNARQALSGDNKGISVSTGFDSSQQMAMITVRDEGCGMDKKTLERIWDPFFTTKGPTEGTGLGLSICNQIVKKHGGAIKIESEPGKGTIVSIFLPIPGAKKGDAQKQS
jgi:signal transduction histidine kinase